MPLSARTRAHLAVGGCLVAARAVAVAVSGGAVLMPDSERYRDPGDPLAPFQAWHGNGPGVLLQVVYQLPLEVAVVLQTVLAAGCWVVTAAYVASHVRRSGWSWTCFALVSAWGLSPWFVLWDAWVVTEAVSTGAVALGAAGLGRLGHREGLALALVGIGGAVLTRPFLGVLLVPVLALVTWWPGGPRGRRRVGAVAAVGVLGAFTAWQLVAVARAPALPYTYLPHPESQSALQATDRLAGRGNVPGYLELARRHGMPACPEAEAVVLGEGTVYTKVAELRAIETCPDLDAWLDAGGLPWPRELTQNTSATVEDLLDLGYWLDESFAAYVYADPRIHRVRELTRTRWQSVVRVLNGAMLVSVALALVAGLVVARRQRAVLGLTAAMSAAFCVGAWAVDGMEYWRHVLPAFVLLAVLATTWVAFSRPLGPQPAASSGGSRVRGTSGEPR
jgi:hypothetical protein